MRAGDHGTEGDEQSIREVVDRWARAVSRKDVADAIACLAPEVLTFDLAPPLQHEGLAVIRRGLEDWFPTWDGPISLQIHDLRITADGHAAYCTSLQRMRGTKTDGTKPDLWFRSTMGLRNIGGTWRIAHEHASTPFYMDGSNKAALDLRPE